MPKRKWIQIITWGLSTIQLLVGVPADQTTVRQKIHYVSKTIRRCEGIYERNGNSFNLSLKLAKVIGGDSAKNSVAEQTATEFYFLGDSSPRNWISYVGIECGMTARKKPSWVTKKVLF